MEAVSAPGIFVDTTEPYFRVEKYRFLRARTAIDMLNVDEDLAEVSTLIQDASECASAAIDARDGMKDELARIEALVCAELRNQPGASGKPKSETQVASEFPLDARYQEVQTLLAKAKLDANLWQALSDSLRTKSANLRDVVALVVAGYVTRDTIMQKRRQEIRDAMPQARIMTRGDAS